MEQSGWENQAWQDLSFDQQPLTAKHVLSAVLKQLHQLMT